MLTKKQRKRLNRLLEDEDLSRIADETAAHFQVLRSAGFRRTEAFEMAMEFHSQLLNAVFDVPPWDEST